MDIKYFYINLDRSSDRKKFMEKQMEKMKLDITRFPGIDGKLLDEKVLRKSGLIIPDLCLEKNGKRGWIGCALSHILIWKKISQEENKNKLFIIFEDDNQILPNFNKKLNDVTNMLPQDWDFIYLNHNKIKGCNIGHNFIKPYNNAGRGYNSNLGCILIHPNGAKKILNFLLPYHEISNIDSVLRRNFDKFNAYFYNERLSVQSPLFKSVRTN